MKKISLIVLLSFFAAVAFAAVESSQASSDEVIVKSGKGKTHCELHFSMESWSVFYKSGKGKGVITCDNGQKREVAIRSHGGGISFGKSKIVNGHGSFSDVQDINKLFGGYAQSEAHAGASKSVGAQALWNGNVGLTLSGKGEGWDLGFALGKLKIEPK